MSFTGRLLLFGHAGNAFLVRHQDRHRDPHHHAHPHLPPAGVLPIPPFPARLKQAQLMNGLSLRELASKVRERRLPGRLGRVRTRRDAAPGACREVARIS